jgi:type VI secretion system secreted protein Hcp
MAVDMFMNIETIKGEAKDAAHKEEIDVLSWSWGVSNSGSSHTGGGGGSGKANVQDLSFTKYIDKSTCDIQRACCNLKHFPKATLICRKAGEKPLEYIKVVMTDVIVTAVSTGGSGGEDKLTENVTLNFAKVSWEYKMQEKDGSGKPAGNYEYNIEENVTA